MPHKLEFLWSNIQCQKCTVHTCIGLEKKISTISGFANNHASELKYILPDNACSDLLKLNAALSRKSNFFLY